MIYSRTIRVSASDPPERLDRFVSEKTGMTRSQVLKLIESGTLTLGGSKARKNHRIKQGDLIELFIEEPETEGLIPEDIKLDICYIDDHIVVADKRPGMVVYPAAGHQSGTLMNAISYLSPGRLAKVGAPLRPGVVHRLDKDTSGLIVVALTDPAYHDLVVQFKRRSIARRYAALVYGSPRTESGRIVAGIGRSRTDRKKMSTRSARSREAITEWSVKARLKASTLIDIKLGTGRTHQIRVHMASVGHPVLGDRTYGHKTSLLVDGEMVAFPRQMLHAYLLGFVHPATGEYMEFRSEMPDDMADLIKRLERPI